MIKVVILDDEQNAVDTLKWKVEKFCQDVEVIQTFTDPIDALLYLQTTTIDLLFIDIEMPKLNGFELLQRIDNIEFDVVFTTAYDEFGIRAIKFSALDYLLKPIQPQELVKSIEKHKSKQTNQITSDQLKVLFSNIKEEDKSPIKIALSTKESIEFVKPEDIIACASDSNYTMVYLSNSKKKLISKTLKEFDELLREFHFFRAHHSHLVNIKHIKEYVRSEGGYLVMSNDLHVPVARSKKDELLKLF